MQIFPNVESVMRLVGALLVEINDEFVVSPRRYMAESTLAAVTDTDPELEERLPSLLSGASSW